MGVQLPQKTENVKWVDGIRGLASFTVVITHLARSFDDTLFLATSAEKTAPRVLQWPIIRVFIHGRIGVAIFALVTGYVCALKPIRQAKANNQEGALVSVAKSAFRRVPRLVLPTCIATLIVWILAQLGVFLICKSTNSRWLNTTAPDRHKTITGAAKALFNALTFTWTKGINSYDPNQWTLEPLLKGSMCIYITLFATVYMQPKYRMMTSLSMWVYYYLVGDATFGMQFFFGMFLSDLSNHQPHLDWLNNHAYPRRLLSPLLLIGGLWLASYPEEKAEWVPWSANLKHFTSYFLLPSHDVARFCTGFGMEMVCLAVHFSPRLKDFLSSKYLLWLGKNSFAVYLIHGTLIRSVLVWLVYGLRLPHMVYNEKGEMVMEPQLAPKGLAYVALFVPIWFVFLYGMANLWTGYVDPLCARWTHKLEKFVFQEADRKEGVLGKPQ